MSYDWQKYQEENGRKLMERLRKQVTEGPKDGIFGVIGHNFSKSLLEGLEKNGRSKNRK